MCGGGGWAIPQRRSIASALMARRRSLPLSKRGRHQGSPRSTTTSQTDDNVSLISTVDDDPQVNKQRLCFFRLPLVFFSLMTRSCPAMAFLCGGSLACSARTAGSCVRMRLRQRCHRTATMARRMVLHVFSAP
jgi:hypothetical protein